MSRGLPRASRASRWVATVVLAAIIVLPIDYFGPRLFTGLLSDSGPEVNVVGNPQGGDELTTPGGDPDQRSRNAAGVGVQLESEADPAVFEGGQPFEWTAYSYVLPGRIDDVPPPPEGLCRERRSWAHSQGGADGGRSLIDVTVRGRGTGEVVIDQIDVNVVSRSTADVAEVLLICPVGGATGAPRAVLFNLDEEPPSTEFYDNLFETTPRSFPVDIRIKPGEVERFFIYAQTKKCRCEWTATFHFVDGSERKEIEVSDGGEPFRTSPTAGLEAFEWSGSSWELSELFN